MEEFKIKLLEKIKNLWEECPDLRFCQLINNIIINDSELFYLEDSEFEKKLDSFETKLKKYESFNFPFSAGDFIKIDWDDEEFYFEYLGNLKFKCLSHHQGYPADYVIIGMVMDSEESKNVSKVSKEEVREHFWGVI